MKSDVSVVGLGHMGSALAATFVDKGYRTTVWNRSPERCKPLLDKGAQAAESALSAVSASPITLISIRNYDDVRAALDVEAASAVFPGRTIVNVTSGVPKEASAAKAWVEARGAEYLDGAVSGYPRHVGREKTVLIFAGDRELWERHRELLLCLGGSSRLVSEDITAAKAMIVFISSYYHIALLGFFEALAYAQTAGIDPQQVLDLVQDRTQVLGDSIDVTVDLLRRGTFETDQSALSGHVAGVKMIKSVIDEAGGRTALLTATAEYLAAADAAGKGALDIAAVLDVMKPTAVRPSAR